MAQTIENVNDRTLLQQFHRLRDGINEEIVPEINEMADDISQEIQDRTDADAQLSYAIEDLQSQINSMGNVFNLKGSVASVSDLPASNNHIGDVWYVEDESTGYVWIDDNGTERWEQLGLTVDLSNYVTTSDLASELDDYQEKLTAGTNISIIGNTISATQPDTSKFEMLSGVSAPSTSTAGAVGQKYLDTTKSDIYVCTTVTDNGDDTFSYTWLLTGGNGKQNKLTAGTNISIVGDVISSSGGLQSVKASDVNSETATSGQVLTADGSGGASWQTSSSGDAVLLDTSSQEFQGDKTLIIKENKKFIFQKKSDTSRKFEIDITGAQAFFTLQQAGTLSLKFHGNYLTRTKNYSTYNYYFPDKSGTFAMTTDITAKVPDAPTTDGTYVLKAVVSSGVATYQWVLE